MKTKQEAPANVQANAM